MMLKRAISVNHQKVSELTHWINQRIIPGDSEDSPLLSFRGDLACNFWFLVVAICHQTSPIGKPPLDGMIGGKQYRGWDYLKNKLEVVCHENNEILYPDYWINVNGNDILDWFGPNITEPYRRAELIRNMGIRMYELGFISLLDIIKSCEFYINYNVPSIIEVLSSFEAYCDPVHKKSYFLLSLLSNSGLVEFKDPQNLGAPVDYHEVRGHLRVGTVTIQDDELLVKIKNGLEVTHDEDICVRQAVHQAIMNISGLSNKSPSVLHYLFWNIFRSHCTRMKPKCAFESTNLPKRYLHLSSEISEHHCPFVRICNAFANKDFSLIEHACATDYY